jgi:O-antigen ligase
MICASFAVVINNVSWMLRLTAAACFTIAAFLLLTTGSMGSSLACLCGIALILIVGKRYLSIKRYVIVVLAIVGFVFVAWSVLPEGIQKYVESRYMERFSQGGVDASDRISIWKNSFAFLMDNPMGVGWSLPIEAQQLGYSSHNDYLAYAMSYGFSCGLLYMFVPAWLLFSLSTVKSRVLDFARLIVILAGVGVVTSLLVNSFSDHLAANRWYYNVVWSIVWYAFFLSKRSLQPSSKKIGHNLAYRRHK